MHQQVVPIEIHLKRQQQQQQQQQTPYLQSTNSTIICVCIHNTYINTAVSDLYNKWKVVPLFPFHYTEGDDV